VPALSTKPERFKLDDMTKVILKPKPQARRTALVMLFDVIPE
jgi:hypothetical protein